VICLRRLGKTKKTAHQIPSCASPQPLQITCYGGLSPLNHPLSDLRKNGGRWDFLIRAIASKLNYLKVAVLFNFNRGHFGTLRAIDLNGPIQIMNYSVF
jgi:hypothetical protein